VVTQSSQTLLRDFLRFVHPPRQHWPQFFKCFLRMWYTTPSTRRLIEENR
jgi:hypothetical protein